MQTQLPAPASDTRTPGLSRWPTIAGLSLALALAAVIGLAQISGSDATRTAETTIVSDASHAMPARSAALSEAQQILYIAASPDQAAHALRLNAEINTLRAEMGQPLVSVGVLMTGTERTPALDGLPGTPGTRVVDLRTPTMTVTPTDPLARELDALMAARGGTPSSH